MSNKKEENISPGEKIIQDTLKRMKIKFEFQKKIEKLTGDGKPFRIADFFLPNYNIYIEYLGDWKNSREKHRYYEKMRVYKLNKISCIYIYPDELYKVEKIIQDGLIIENVVLKKRKKEKKNLVNQRKKRMY